MSWQRLCCLLATRVSSARRAESTTIIRTFAPPAPQSWRKEGTVGHRQSKESSILWSHHEETRELPGERASNDARCTQARRPCTAWVDSRCEHWRLFVDFLYKILPIFLPIFVEVTGKFRRDPGFFQPQCRSMCAATLEAWCIYHIVHTVYCRNETRISAQMSVFPELGI